MKQNDDFSGCAISRRRAMFMLAGLLAYQSFPRLAFATTEAASNFANSLDRFIELSSAVTGVEKLDRDTAQKILDLIRSEPWGKEHLAQIAEKIFPSGADSNLTVSRQELLNPAKFTEGERWFIGHFLTTWFTGVFYHQIGNHVVSYRHALMHTAMQDVRPIPGHCDGSFGFWSKPPVGAA
jgi:hypothetical protein